MKYAFQKVSIEEKVFDFTLHDYSELYLTYLRKTRIEGAPPKRCAL